MMNAEKIRPIELTNPPIKPILIEPKKSTKKLEKKASKKAIPKENEPNF